jgi:hypothetical protein
MMRKGPPLKERKKNTWIPSTQASHAQTTLGCRIKGSYLWSKMEGNSARCSRLWIHGLRALSLYVCKSKLGNLAVPTGDDQDVASPQVGVHNGGMELV